MTDQSAISLVVAYGTDMGNAEDAAMSFAEGAQAAGLKAEAVELNQLEPHGASRLRTPDGGFGALHRRRSHLRWRGVDVPGRPV